MLHTVVAHHMHNECAQRFAQNTFNAMINQLDLFNVLLGIFKCLMAK